ncbi:MAG: hypothetical protein M1814_005410 [Vezdaea aestivalis]|nr:MAG: hypothetical protein M1814_005410 [Vezdaea aestivalis]
MAPWSTNKSKEDDEQDLHTALDEGQRAEFTLLIANATESIRKGIVDVFESDNLPTESSTTTQKPVSADQAEEPSQGNNDDVKHASPTATIKELQANEDRGKEQDDKSKEPEVQDLKTAALAYFDEWSASVLSRIGEIVNSPDKAQKQKEKATPVQPSDKATKSVDDVSEPIDLDTTLHALYPPIPTPLSKLPESTRAIVLHSTLLILLSLKHYSSHSRVLLLYLCSSLSLPPNLLTNDETKIALGLLNAAKHLNANAETQSRADANRTSRYWKVGLASAVGAVVVGITGGLAAPLVAAGLGTVFGAFGLGTTAAAVYLGVLAQSGIVVGSLFGAYGASMTGKMMDAYAKEVDDFAFLPLRSGHRSGHIHTADRRLRVAIGITGWLTELSEIVHPWRIIDGETTEAFALRFETDSLLSLGNAMTTLFQSAAWAYAKGEILRRTVLGALGAALWPLAILKIGKVVDNPFSVAMTRADKAGEVLADALINRAQGERPVTLIGFSLGARVIHTCLKSLAERRAFGLIESAVLIGVPAPGDAETWRELRSVVSGRLVNVYSENDSVLSFMYRASSAAFGAAGLAKIEGVKGVENVDVSEMVSGHLRYRYLAGSVLRKVGWPDLDLNEAQRQEETLKLVEQKGTLEAEAKDGDVDTEKEEAKIEEEVKKKNDKTVGLKKKDRKDEKDEMKEASKTETKDLK